jgi:DNA-binding NarL/FixJ family response regulator
MDEKITILLVEDHVMTRLGTAMVIENTAGFELIAQAQDGSEGVLMAQKHAPDVVLMDIGLPKVDGIEATRKIKEAVPECAVLMFTSRDEPEDVFAALKAGADGYIMKGASAHTLVNAINTVNEKAGWLDPQIARLVLSAARAEDNEPAQASQKTLDAKGKNRYGLTKRELEVLALIVEGLSNPEISEKLFVSLATTKAHVHSILQKLYISDRTKAAVYAIKEGLV